MAVNAAGTNQAHQVDGLAGINGSFHVLDQHGVLEHLTVPDGFGDEGQPVSYTHLDVYKRQLRRWP